MLAATTLTVTIPVGSTAHVHVPLVGGADHTDVSESDTVFWHNGQYIGGVAGITGASVDGTDLVIVTTSGQYAFVALAQ